MWDKMNSYVSKHHMLKEGDSVLLGLSGGADSVCLLRYFTAIRETMKLKVYAVHVNHLLRAGEAERDQEFTRELCEKWEVPLQIFRRNIKEESRRLRCSLEEAGREIRYACFDEAAAHWKCNKIAVAHHKNDLAETMVFRMIRGTGPSGLAGIRPVNGNIIRPLLGTEKAEILDMLEDLGQDYVEDSSNQEEAYSRNCIRHRILPEMQRLNGQAVAHLGQLSEQVQELTDYLKPIFDHIFESCVIKKEKECILPENAFQNLRTLERKEILRRMLFYMSGRRKDISAVHVEQLMELMDKPLGKRIYLPYELIAERTVKGIALTETENVAVRSDAREIFVENNHIIVDMKELEQTGRWTTPVGNGKNISFYLKKMEECKIIKSDCVKYFDYDTIKCKLCLRTRQSGDYFIMDKEGRHKSLKRYFIDEKIPAVQRDHILLLAEESHVLWILGGRISEAYKVGPETRRVLAVHLSRGF